MRAASLWRELDLKAPASVASAAPTSAASERCDFASKKKKQGIGILVFLLEEESEFFFFLAFTKPWLKRSSSFLLLFFQRALETKMVTLRRAPGAARACFAGESLVPDGVGRGLGQGERRTVEEKKGPEPSGAEHERKEQDEEKGAIRKRGSFSSPGALRGGPSSALDTRTSSFQSTLSKEQSKRSSERRASSLFFPWRF